MTGPLPDEFLIDTIIITQGLCFTTRQVKDIIDPDYFIPKNSFIELVYSEKKYSAVIYKNRIFVICTKITIKEANL
jgi:hypothetical protein